MAPEKWVPVPYMRKAVRWVLSNPAAGLLLPPGMRKTSITLRAFLTLRKEEVVDRMLVLAPLSVCGVWEDEVAKWDFAKDLRVVVLHGPKKEKLLREPADIHVINYDGLPWLMRQRDYDWPEMLVCDESTKLKHTNTQRFKLLKPKLKDFTRRVILTGTPSPNGLMDLFGQLYVLDLGERLHPYITRFRNEFFIERMPHQFQPLPDAEERILLRIRDICLHLDRADYLDLPDIVETRVKVKLPQTAHRLYKTLERAFFLDLDSDRVTAANAAVLSGKLRQAAGGAVYGDVQGEWSTLHTAKVDAVLDRLEECGEPVFMLYEYEHEKVRLVEALEKEGYVVDSVEGSPRRRRRAVEAWNRGELDVLIAHPAAAGHGLNLQEGGRRVFWFGPTWNLEHWIQATDRIYRSGQEWTVFVDVFTAEDTCDEAIILTRDRKDRGQRSILNGLKQYRSRKR